MNYLKFYYLIRDDVTVLKKKKKNVHTGLYEYLIFFGENVFIYFLNYKL